MKISDPAADLAVISALASSLKDRVVEGNQLFIGEVGLGGEVRKVTFLEQRLREAEKMGMKRAVIPESKATANGSMKLKAVAFISHLF